MAVVKRSTKIEPIKALAERDEQARSLDYSGCKQRLDEACSKLEELLNYREEYDSAPLSDEGHLDIAKLQENRQFLVKLTQVIQLQEQNVERLRELTESAREAWLNSRVKTKNLDRLSENYRDEEDRAAERVEQKQSDELNSQRFLWQQLQRD